MHAEIVMIGTELLLGEIVDTNANLLARGLRDIGLDLYFKTTVGDNEERITEVLNNALDRSDVIITSGGIGPTVDDMTRQAVANATGRKLVYSLELEDQIAARFRSFGRSMAENNKRQAYIPEGALPLPNAAGTAPCYLAEDTRGRGFIISLPGVPRELEYMLNNTVIPILIERMGGRKAMKVRVLRTCAVGESNIDRGIGDLMTGKNPTVGTAAHAGQTDVRIAAKADTEEEAEALVAAMEAKLRERLGVAVYGVDKETVVEVVGRLLEKQGLKLAVVDTLTGGQLAREMRESGFGHLLATDLFVSSPAEAFTALGVTAEATLNNKNGANLTAELAAKIAAPNIIGTALLGPLSDGEHDNLTFVAVHGPGDLRVNQLGRNYADTDYVHRWLVIQGLDWVRRAVLGELESPVDWN